jgi:putative redox protein
MIRSFTDATRNHTSFANGTYGADADVPVEKGGAGNGFGPHELLEAAVATCMTITARQYATQHELPLSGARCEVRIDRSVPGAVTLHYALSLEGPLSADQTVRLREAVGRCPVARTLSGKIALTPTSEAHQPQEMR